MKLLLDTNIINNLTEMPGLLGKLQSLKEFADAEIYVCSSIINELSAIPDKLVDKRNSILHDLFLLEPHIVYDGVGVLGVTKCDEAVVSDGTVYKKIINENQDNVRDAIIAETAVNNGLILVTNDKELYNKMKTNGYDVFNTDDLENGKKVLESKYPLLNQEYVSGFVCYFDILGFGSFSSNETNIEQIIKLFVNLQTAIKLNEQNRFIGNISMFSDSVFFTVTDGEMKEAGFFESIIDFVCLARDIIQHHIHTDVRAGIVHGKYINIKNDAIFGPAITQAVRLAEPKKENDQLKKYLDGDPAAIIIHPNVLQSEINEYGELEYLLKNKKGFVQLGDTNYFLVNPYYFIFETRSIGSLLFGKKIDKKQVCEEWLNYIMTNRDFKDFDTKYKLSLQFLDTFKNDNSVE